MDNDSRECIFSLGSHTIYSNGKKVMVLQEENNDYHVTYRVVDLLTGKYDMSFTNYDNALEYCDRCLKDGATALRLITEEYSTTYEKVSR